MFREAKGNSTRVSDGPKIDIVGYPLLKVGGKKFIM
jgi:hypothetical protein